MKDNNSAEKSGASQAEEIGITQKPSSLGRMLKAANYSYQGFTYSFKNEASFREEVLASLIIVPLGIWLGDTAIERILMVCSVLLVLVVELLNTAVEAVVDRFGGERHVLAGAAKDAGSAAVLLTLLMAVFTWGSILIPRFF